MSAYILLGCLIGVRQGASQRRRVSHSGRKAIQRWLLWLVPWALVTACAPEVAKAPPEDVTLQLKWIHQAQFAGFYLAEANGHYARENLRVHFLEGGRHVDLAEPVIAGRAQFAVAAPEDVIVNRSQGQPLTAIAAIYRRSAVAFVSKADSGITRPAHFRGKTIAAAGTSGSVRDFEWQYYAMMRRLRIDESSAKLVLYDPEYAAFLDGDVDVTAAYLTSGVLRLQGMNLRLNLIRPGDYGVHAYSDTLITLEQTIETRPELVTRFLRASLDGWRDAIGSSASAVDAALRFARFADRRFQTDMMEALYPLVHTGELPIGWMRAEDWTAMNRNLRDQGLPSAESDCAGCFTLEFLERIYGTGGAR